MNESVVIHRVRGCEVEQDMTIVLEVECHDIKSAYNERSNVFVQVTELDDDGKIQTAIKNVEENRGNFNQLGGKTVHVLARCVSRPNDIDNNNNNNKNPNNEELSTIQAQNAEVEKKENEILHGIMKTVDMEKAGRTLIVKIDNGPLHAQRVDGFETINVFRLSKSVAEPKRDKKELINWIRKEWEEYYLELGIKKLYVKNNNNNKEELDLYGYGKVRAGVVARHINRDYGVFIPIQMNYMGKLREELVEKYLILITKYLKAHRTPSYVSQNDVSFGLHPLSTLCVGSMTAILNLEKDMECREATIFDWSFRPNVNESYTIFPKIDKNKEKLLHSEILKKLIGIISDNPDVPLLQNSPTPVEIFGGENGDDTFEQGSHVLPYVNSVLPDKLNI